MKKRCPWDVWGMQRDLQRGLEINGYVPIRLMEKKRQWFARRGYTFELLGQSRSGKSARVRCRCKKVLETYVKSG